MFSMFNDFSLFPLDALFSFGGLFLILLAVGFWILMIIDCSNRRFNNGMEKVVWLLVIILLQTLGALIYLVWIFLINKKGVLKR